MMHPSYNELYEAINQGNENAEPIGSSRYSICVATAKRARQIIDHAETYSTVPSNKPLSVAIDEIYHGKVKILSAEDNFDYDASIYADEEN
jgi:DNA-directed RNA polymerase subunit omega